jgi:LmbE family N-acetylglucosaminyl deacetylase
MTDPAEAPPFQPLPEEWERALIIVAHPDDIEYGSAAAVARWTGQGKTISYTLVTSGEAGIDGIPPEEAAPLREAEELASAAIVGVDKVEFLGHADGVIEHSIQLRRDLTHAIRRARPQIVMTSNYADTWGGTFPNQPDHIAVGRTVIEAVQAAGNRWIFSDDAVEPWGGVDAVWIAGAADAAHAVDVSDTFAIGMESLRAHAAYLRGLGDAAAGTEEFLEGMARASGARLGTTYAVPFKVISLRFG